MSLNLSLVLPPGFTCVNKTDWKSHELWILSLTRLLATHGCEQYLTSEGATVDAVIPKKAEGLKLNIPPGTRVACNRESKEFLELSKEDQIAAWKEEKEVRQLLAFVVQAIVSTVSDDIKRAIDELGFTHYTNQIKSLPHDEVYRLSLRV
jgi:hypothetical protein